MQTDDISLQSGIISGSPRNCNLRSYPWSGCTAQDLFPTGTPNSCHMGFLRAVFKSTCWSGFPGEESNCSTGDLGLIPVWEDPLEKGMATHSSILTWKTPWTEEPNRLSPWGRRVRHD